MNFSHHLVLDSKITARLMRFIECGYVFDVAYTWFSYFAQFAHQNYV